MKTEEITAVVIKTTDMKAIAVILAMAAAKET